MANKALIGGGAVAGVAAAALAVSAMVAPNDPFAPCVEARLSEHLGGPFELTSETGARVTDATVFTRPSLVYFGYTFCPDICPVDGARNAEAVDLLAAQGLDIQPVFITVDPKRDTPEVLAEYTDFLHPEMIGLTGSAEDIAAVTRAYKSYSAVPEAPEDEEYYLVDHSTYTFLVLPGHGTVDLIRRDEAATAVAERAACIIERA